jgi:polysaccharide transporter, PST family
MVWLYALLGLNYLVPLAVLPYLVRVLGVERYGLLAFAQAFAQYFSILTDYGFNLSATKQVAILQNDRERVAQLFWSVMAIKIAFMIVGMVLMAIIVAVVPRFRADAGVYAVAYAAVIGSVLFPVWLFQGMEQMRHISVVSGITKMLSAALVFVFVHHRSDYLLALAIQSAGVLIAGIVGFRKAVVHFKLTYYRPLRSGLISALREGWHLFLSTAAISLYTNTNVVLVGLLAGNAEAGYFGVAEKLIRAVSGSIAPIAQALFPHVNSLASQCTKTARRFLSRSLRWMAVLTFVPSAALLLFARQIALLCFGAIAPESVLVIRWIAFLPFLIGLSNIFGIQSMIPFGLERQFSRILIVAGLLNIVMAVPLIHWFAAEGAAASVLITEAVVTLATFLALEWRGIHLLRAETVAA